MEAPCRFQAWRTVRMIDLGVSKCSESTGTQIWFICGNPLQVGGLLQVQANCILLQRRMEIVTE